MSLMLHFLPTLMCFDIFLPNSVQGILKGRFYRDQCVFHDGHYFKVNLTPPSSIYHLFFRKTEHSCSLDYFFQFRLTVSLVTIFT